MIEKVCWECGGGSPSHEGYYGLHFCDDCVSGKGKDND